MPILALIPNYYYYYYYYRGEIRLPLRISSIKAGTWYSKQDVSIRVRSYNLHSNNRGLIIVITSLIRFGLVWWVHSLLTLFQWKLEWIRSWKFQMVVKIMNEMRYKIFYDDFIICPYLYPLFFIVVKLNKVYKYTSCNKVCINNF